MTQRPGNDERDCRKKLIIMVKDVFDASSPEEFQKSGEKFH